MFYSQGSYYGNFKKQAAEVRRERGCFSCGAKEFIQKRHQIECDWEKQIWTLELTIEDD